MCHKILCFSYVECQIACLCGAKRLYFYRIAVALRMECVDLSDTKDGGKMSGAVALRMECVDLSVYITFNVPELLSHFIRSAWI